MYKKILVPLDRSEVAERALKHVKAVATACHVSDVVLLGVVEPLQDIFHGTVGMDEAVKLRKKIEDKLEEYFSKVADSLKKEGIAVTTVRVEGKASGEIIDYAHNNEVDLIIMSSRGASGISRWAFGSVFDKVLRRVKVPVLVVTS